MAAGYGIVFNPTKVDEAALRDTVATVLGDAEEVLWWETTADDPGRAMCEAAVEAGCDVVIAVGGDGTVRAVAEVLATAEHAPALGIVPQGTGNLLARNLGIPVIGIRRALDVISAGKHREIDMGWVSSDVDGGETGFLVMIGFGLDAHMLTETDEQLKERAGWLAYAEALGRAISAAETVDFTLRLDEGEVNHLTGHTLLIGNCGDIQGGLRLLPDAEPDDGLLDLMLIGAENATEWLRTLRTMVWDNGIRRLLPGADGLVSSDVAQHLSGRSARIALSTPVAFEIDGEEAGRVSQLHVRVQPGALRVLC